MTQQPKPTEKTPFSQTPLPECGDCPYVKGPGCGWLCSWWAYRKQHAPETCPCGHSVERHRFDVAAPVN